MIPDRGTRERWKRLAKESMYVPREFMILLRAVDELEIENNRLNQELEIALNNNEEEDE